MPIIVSRGIECTPALQVQHPNPLAECLERCGHSPSACTSARVFSLLQYAGKTGPSRILCVSEVQVARALSAVSGLESAFLLRSFVARKA